MESRPLQTEILSYLIKHPMAEDTIEGIVEWWVLQQEVEQRVSAVKSALTQLMAGGFVLQTKGLDGRVYYHLNPSAMKESRRLVAQLVRSCSKNPLN